MRKIACLLVAAALLAPAGAHAARAPLQRPPTPVLLDQAVERGELSRERADDYLMLALREADELPERFASATPWHGTVPLLGAVERASGGESDQISTIGASLCSISVMPQLSVLNTEHFRIEYTPGTILGGLTIEDYAAALEESWTTEVDTFGWAAPPLPRGKYLVRVDPTLSPLIYGLVAAQQQVGDNPNTSWNDEDSWASCMVLNANYANGLFPSTPLGAMTATAAHEFNHSIQFGYGALIGNGRPQDVFIEGGATWVEDEVFDDANDSWYYLWPDFTEALGANEDFPYRWWIAFRGMTEWLGTNVGGGAEDVMQRFWETVSKGEGTDLAAMASAIAVEGKSLAVAFHEYAIATGLTQACGGGYVSPYCYEEAAGYIATAGRPTAMASLGSNNTVTQRARDHFALHWTDLRTTGGAYNVAVRNTTAAGTFRASIACNTGSSVQVTPFPSTAGGNQTITVSGFNPAGCTRVLLVVTNETVLSNSPTTSSQRNFTITTTPA